MNHQHDRDSRAGKIAAARVPRDRLVQRLVTLAESDPRVVDGVDSGSGSEGRLDARSDIDVALFIRDDDFATFARDWVAWARQLGPLLLAYVGGVGHPWTVVDAEPVPVRIDFTVYRAADLSVLLTWPNSPTSARAMALYDATGGALTATARQLVGKDLAPSNLAATFARVSGDFWYYLLRTFAQYQREQFWAVRFDFNHMILGNLLALLRIEVGAVDRWQAMNAAVGIERVINAGRRARLDACISGPEPDDLLRALVSAAELGRDVCAAIAVDQAWPWPRALGARVVDLVNMGTTTDERSCKGASPRSR